MKHIRKIKIFALAVSVFSAFSFAKAADSSDLDSAREQDIAKRAKSRMYPGGSDEEDLRVQAQLLIPTRKMTPKASDEQPETSSEEDE